MHDARLVFSWSELQITQDHGFLRGQSKFDAVVENPAINKPVCADRQGVLSMQIHFSVRLSVPNVSEDCSPPCTILGCPQTFEPSVTIVWKFRFSELKRQIISSTSPTLRKAVNCSKDSTGEDSKYDGTRLCYRAHSWIW